jgi:hypothetical protein
VISLSGRNSGLFSDAAGGGAGGAIELQARDLHLTEGAILSATSSGRGNAGRLRIIATERFRSDQSVLTTEAIRADGGNIQLMAGSLVQLIDSQLTATSRGGQGKEGNIMLSSPLVVLDRSQIRTQAFGGPGGNIRIGAEVFLASPESVVSASSTLELIVAVTTLSGTVAPLPQAFVNIAELLPVRCAARFSGGQASSLVVSGRDGLPLDPSGVLPSPLVLEERLAADPVVTGVPPQPPSTATFCAPGGSGQSLAPAKVPPMTAGTGAVSCAGADQPPIPLGTGVHDPPSPHGDLMISPFQIEDEIAFLSAFLRMSVGMGDSGCTKEV